MAYRSFQLKILLRILLLLPSIGVLLYSLLFKNWYITGFCVLVLLAGQVLELLTFIQKAHKQLGQFVAAIRQSDFSQRFSTDTGKSALNELHKLFNVVLDKFQKVSAEKEAHHQYLQAVVEHVGIGVISFDEHGEVQLLNKALKELLHLPHLKNIAALKRISPELHQAVAELQNNESRLVTVKQQQESLLLSVRVSALKLQQHELKIVSIQNIRSELEEQELEAWHKLIRVLTHEIMNSLTPVVSLTSTIRGLVEQEVLAHPESQTIELTEEVLEDVQVGLSTIERRSKGIMHFVENYRRLTHVPQPHKQVLAVQELFKRVQHLLEPQLINHQVKLLIEEPPQDLTIFADPELIEQVLINLVKNGMEACSQSHEPCVEVVATTEAN
ncbi:MAG: ATP-binding protein, partial [Hymenobacteraceae bacterium]|nr:ATP-binding protein [Hymenobacteraceae bacterium]MDX5512793.1 ATP-binding protein [Hymenobacteraceae bacterium]